MAAPFNDLMARWGAPGGRAMCSIPSSSPLPGAMWRPRP